MKTYPAKKGKRGKLRKLPREIQSAGREELGLGINEDMSITKGVSAILRRAPPYDYQVTCDETNNPQDTIDRGELHIGVVVHNPSPDMVAAIEGGWPLGLLIPPEEADTNEC